MRRLAAILLCVVVWSVACSHRVHVVVPAKSEGAVTYLDQAAGIEVWCEARNRSNRDREFVIEVDD